MSSRIPNQDYERIRDMGTTPPANRRERRHPELIRRLPADLDVALPREVAALLDTTPEGLAQMRYRGTGPKFIKRGRRVLYRWDDVRAYFDANTLRRTDDPREVTT
jgi:hypothetical protein